MIGVPPEEYTMLLLAALDTFAVRLVVAKETRLVKLFSVEPELLDTSAGNVAVDRDAIVGESLLAILSAVVGESDTEGAEEAGLTDALNLYDTSRPAAT